MSWPRSPSAWERREKILALFLTAVVAGGGLAPFIGWAALPVAVAIAVVVGAVLRLRIGAHKAALEETLEEADLDRRLRARIKPIGEVDPRQIGVDPATQEMLPGGEVPEYLPRTKDREVRSALEEALNGEGRWIVAVFGSSKVGKSRLLFEAIKWCGERDEVHLVAPKDGVAVKSLLQPRQLPTDLAGKKLVVWLDDLETFVAEGIDLDALREWHERAGVVFAVTYGGKGSERVQETSSGGLSVIIETLLNHAKQISLVKTDPTELEGLPGDISPGFRSEIENHGLAAIMVSGPALERKLMTGRHGLGEPGCPSGVALVRAAVDWARCGRTDPIPTEKLRALWEEYLPSNARPSDENFAESLDWASKPVSGTIALLHAVVAVAGVLPYDYIVSFVDSQEDTGPPDGAWACALEDPNPAQALSIGSRAVIFGHDQSVETAMRIGSSADDPRLSRIGHYNLGVRFRQRGELEEAEAAFLRADEMGLGEGSSNLGFLLQARGDLEGAEAAFRRAVERGVDAGAFNLGVLLQQQGDLPGAREAYELAEELGDEDAANNLGGVLEEQGDPEGAEAAYERAIAKGKSNAAFNLGLFFEKKEEFDRAVAAYEHAEELGDDEAALNLGVLLMDHFKDPAGAEKVLRRSIERSGSHKAAFNLAILLREEGDVEGAEEMLRQAIDLGDGRAAVTLGNRCKDQGDLEGAESYFLRAIELKEATGAFNLGVLLLEKEDLPGARDAFEQALLADDASISEQAKLALDELAKIGT
jgi:tetratricopeptide (TPR) repeat protein